MRDQGRHPIGRHDGQDDMPSEPGLPEIHCPEPCCGERKSARRRILDAAMELFYREGIRAVGVDAVIAHAGVAKMSLYRAFPSKDDLIVAFLEEISRRYWLWWDEVAGRHPGQPRQQVEALFDGLARHTTGPQFRGCPFTNTAIEFPDPGHPGRAVVTAHRRELRRRLAELSLALGASDAELLADQLLLLMEGAYSAGTVMCGESPCHAVGAAAAALIAAQCR
jgi:AcrR family transcriptional regulator